LGDIILPMAHTPDDTPRRRVEKNAFELLGLPIAYNLEPAVVNRAFLRRSAQLHPDRTLAAAENLDDSTELSAAKACLLDDEQRAIAVIAAWGGPGASENKSLPPGLLAEMLEVRETMEVEIGGNAGDAEEARARWRAWAGARRQEYKSSIGALLNSYEAGSDPQLLAGARVQLNAWRYIERMLEQLDPMYRLE